MELPDRLGNDTASCTIESALSGMRAGAGAISSEPASHASVAVETITTEAKIASTREELRTAPNAAVQRRRARDTGSPSAATAC